ncbi:ATP-binding cassette domain-containing protein [Aeromonas sp. sif0611]|uniref:ATP-binding cassette domain-containing protein n=1 Tax=Aeromonas sp. sif0611 TaxID=2854787 RepID=UPI001C47E2D8|nr:ATP-binding cassette domain-containing protein [Aeromonas sp. sif0611]MBV7469093.1 ATP-binding cassette domain-containing protein [Aeromonas sp. sif0611]
MSPVKPSSDPLWLLEARALGISARLSPLDLAWAGGQLVALLGPNGSGKSTLLGALAGILPADGAVLLGGKVLTDLSWPELARRRAMLPQRQPQLFHIPVFQVLSLGLDEEGLPETQGRAVAEICAALELDALLARDFNRLSGGEQQRVLIARTLLQLWPGLNTDGRVLLLDEPLAGLDLHHQLALLRLLKRLARQGLLVVIAIHDINLAIDWADRILCLQQGRVVSEGGVDVIDEALLERVFQIKTDRVEAAGRVWFMPSL